MTSPFVLSWIETEHILSRVISRNYAVIKQYRYKYKHKIDHHMKYFTLQNTSFFQNFLEQLFSKPVGQTPFDVAVAENIL